MKTMRNCALAAFLLVGVAACSSTSDEGIVCCDCQGNKPACSCDSCTCPKV